MEAMHCQSHHRHPQVLGATRRASNERRDRRAVALIGRRSDVDLGIAGKVALVTGAGGSLGRAIAIALASEQCTVVATDLELSAAQETAAMCSSKPGRHQAALQLDVSDARSIENAIDTVVRQHGSLDILVNNAGILKIGMFLESKPSDWDDVSRVNVASIVHAARAAVAVMGRQRWGRIVNIASVSAMRGGGVIGNTLYGVSKAGVVALTMGLAREWATMGITVNAIAPGLAETNMTREHLPQYREGALRKIPMGRLARPEDIAAAVLFLVSEQAGYITGVTLPVDGGYLTV
jgi:NAD(P)-dependent dehydrogenase (short-subunit alcohol dehydrogenase family)